MVGRSCRALHGYVRVATWRDRFSPSIKEQNILCRQTKDEVPREALTMLAAAWQVMVAQRDRGTKANKWFLGR